MNQAPLSVKVYAVSLSVCILHLESSMYLCSHTYTAKEIRRLKLNWLFLILLCILETINYTSTLPTFHQFVTNPTSESMAVNETGKVGADEISPACHNVSIT